MNSFGRYFKITTFGESHGPMNGVVIDGLPGGLAINSEQIKAQLDRRRPTGNIAATARVEPDDFQIVSGIDGGITNGAPLTIIIPNVAQKSHEYDQLRDVFRPGQGDFGWYARYGQPIGDGGGRLSGRETVARVAAGAVARMILQPLKIDIWGYTAQIGSCCGQAVERAFIENNPYRLADEKIIPAVETAVAAARSSGDSLGGRIHLTAQNVPAGWGGPVFDKLDAQIGAAMFSIGAVKGVLFGVGENFVTSGARALNDCQTGAGFLSNNAGGIVGGISNGNALELDLIIKAPPSVAASQQMLSHDGKIKDITIQGRHDCCLCPRIIPVAEAMLAIVLCDAYLEYLAVKRQ